jgi:flavin reductase (DIM6/NTAB) family NADH-FMN oxidoreductase RutF
MSVDPAEFRRILGHWATGVAVVATRGAAGEPRGLTANAVASVSLEPPLVLVCVDCRADSHHGIREAGIFSVNVLLQADERIARRFAADEIAAKFEGVAWRTEVTGAPVLDDALAWVDCRVHHECEGGDHTIFIGEVLAGGADEGEPLVYYRGGFNRLVP